MSAFIATPPTPETPEDSVIVVDDWFPEISLINIRDTIRMGENVVTHARLEAAVLGALVTALRHLADWRSAHASRGVASLADIDDIAMMGTARPVVLWQRIVRFYTAAEIADGHRDITATDEGQIRAEEENMTADQYRRLAHNAVTDLLAIRPADEPAGEFDPVDGQRNRVALI